MSKLMHPELQTTLTAKAQKTTHLININCAVQRKRQVAPSCNTKCADSSQSALQAHMPPHANDPSAGSPTETLLRLLLPAHGLMDLIPDTPFPLEVTSLVCHPLVLPCSSPSAPEASWTLFVKSFRPEAGSERPMDLTLQSRRRDKAHEEPRKGREKQEKRKRREKERRFTKQVVSWTFF